MAAVDAIPWTDDGFAPGGRRRDREQSATELSPYRVTVGDDVYDQSQFTADTSHRFHNFTSGIGAGKTVSGIIRMAANVYQWNEGEMGMIVTPTSLGIKNVILPELAKWGFLESWEYRGPQSSEPGLHAPNGARVLLESAENERKIERLRGPSISWFWIDEPNIVPAKAWDILTGRLRVGDYRNAFVTGTPKGRNWVWRKFHPDSDDQIKSTNNVFGVPSYANPHLPLDYRKDILDEYDDNFYAQEVEGRFVKFEGLVYRWFDRDDHIQECSEPDRVDEWIYGVDFGHNNPAAIVALARQGDLWTATETFYERRLTDTDLAEAAADMVARNGEGRFYCDPSDPGAITEFERAGVSADAAVNDITPGIKTVTSIGQRDNLRVDESCQPLITEFNQYQYPEGDDTKDKPIDANNHALDALRYALHTHETGGGADDWSGSDVGLGGL
jgi:PBSX family phage terminase large subunit